jgi:acetylornithine deacetylase/succinyl-diaminopimelate desuccinylase-like protein
MSSQHERLLSELVEIKSYSGDEVRIREYIRGWFKERDIDSFVQDENLVVHLKGKDATRAFIFNSHMDTVTAGQNWSVDPWKPRQLDGKFVGLGSSDMKSGLSASMLVAEQISKSGKPPVDMWFTYVVKEEIDGSGTESFAKWFDNAGNLSNYKDCAAIFTEPNSLEEVEHGHRGNYFLIVEAKGASGHSSRPNKLTGELAVRKMFRFADVFQNAVLEWKREFPDNFFDPSITLGEMTSIIANAEAKRIVDEDGKERMIVAVGSANKFPENCLATFDLRTTPNTHNLLYDRVKQIAEQSGVTIEQLYSPAPAGFTDPKEKIVKIASTVGGIRKLTVSQASADLGSLTARGVKAVILGPGEKLQCHEPDEYCYPEQIPQAVGIYKKIVEAWAQ